MMLARVKRGCVMGRLEGGAGLAIPDELLGLPDARLAVLDGAVVDAAGITTWWVAPSGRRAAERQSADDQAVSCAWDDRLVPDGDGGWRVESEEERAARAWAPVRETRDARLASSDWTQLPDAPLSDKARKAWGAYRQGLRDVPQSFAAPEQVVWPEAPEG